MSATTTPTTFSELYTDLLNRVRADTSTTATSNQAKRYINTALFDMHVMYAERFLWAERRAVLVTQPEYNTGTLSVSQGDTALTGAGSTLWNTNNAFGVANMRVGGKIRIGGGDEVYEIASISSDTAAVLTSDFVPSDASGASYNYFEDEYALAGDFLRPIDRRRLTDGGVPIELVGRADFRARYPRNHITGQPFVGTLVDLSFSGNTTPVRKVVLHRPPDKAYQLNYSYVTSNLAVSSTGTEQTQLVSDTDEPIIPVRYRHVLVLHALYQWYRDKKDDSRSAEVKAEYVELVTRIVADTEIGQQKARISPMTAAYKVRSRRPWGGGGHRFDLNGAFDRLEDRN